MYVYVCVCTCVCVCVCVCAPHTDFGTCTQQIYKYCTPYVQGVLNHFLISDPWGSEVHKYQLTIVTLACRSFLFSSIRFLHLNLRISISDLSTAFSWSTVANLALSMSVHMYMDEKAYHFDVTLYSTIMFSVCTCTYTHTHTHTQLS